MSSTKGNPPARNEKPLTVARLRRHAELYGSEQVFEVAASDGLSPTDLGALTLALRRIDGDWRLSRAQRADLLARLDGERLSDRRLREYLGISQDTLRRMRDPAVSAALRPQNGDPDRNGGVPR
jgi:hypothetical protein